MADDAGGPPAATHRFLADRGRALMVSTSVDLGELTPGHRVWVTGIENHDGFFSLHYELVPAVVATEIPAARGRFHWRLEMHDDIGVEYAQDGRGALDPESSYPSSHGVRDLGVVSGEATKLFFSFGSAPGIPAHLTAEVTATLDLQVNELSFGR